MSNSAVSVIARFQAKPGKEAELKQELLKLISPTRVEHGCINYDLHESSEHRGQFLFYENWNSRAALDQHLQTAHLKKFLAMADSLLAVPLEISLWKQIDDK